MKTIKLGVLIFNIAILFFVLLRLVYVDNDVSFDRVFYLEFIKEVSELSLHDFYARLVLGFPYFGWADFGAFESGFAVISYFFSMIMSPALAWAAMGGISLAIKLLILALADVKIFKIYSALIFSLILFETNALRAGMAVSMIMLGIFLLSGKRFYSLLFFLFSCLLHLSSFAIVILIFFGSFIHKSKYIGLYISCAVAGSAVLAVSLPLVSDLVGGKLHEYYIQSTQYNWYTGASGLNFSSVICLIFFIKFAWVVNEINFYKNTAAQRKMAIIGCLISGVCASIILFSGPFAIVGDRIWQMAFIPLLLLELQIGHVKNVFYRVINQVGFAFIGIYVFINLLIRYPQSNFFAPLLPAVDLVPPTVY